MASPDFIVSGCPEVFRTSCSAGSTIRNVKMVRRTRSDGRAINSGLTWIENDERKLRLWLYSQQKPTNTLRSGNWTMNNGSFLQAKSLLWFAGEENRLTPKTMLEITATRCLLVYDIFGYAWELATPPSPKGIPELTVTRGWIRQEVFVFFRNGARTGNVASAGLALKFCGRDNAAASLLSVAA